ncbi:MAG: FAD-dependent oxidoreductase [Pseudomonadota bacterium]
MMKLFESGKIGKLTLKNRIVMAAMGVGGLIQPDGRLSQAGIDYYVARAKGGTGLIITSSCRASRELSELEQFPVKPMVSHLIVDSKIYTGWLDELADGVHDYGAKVALQLHAGEGRVISRQKLIERGIQSPIGPSSLPYLSDPSITTRGLTTEEVERLVAAFTYAAEIAMTAGIDAIELNCHGGYILDQFQTALWNKRSDKYGGDLAGRLRCILEIIQGIKQACGPDFPIIVKYGLTHYFKGGREIEEGLEIARRLERAGVDALSIDAGSYETHYWLIPSEFQPAGCTIDLAEMVRKTVKIPVMAVSKLGYPQLAEKVLEDQKADFIALGRPLLADPEWPKKLKEGRLEDIRPCIGCLEGCHKRIKDGKTISCTVNPATGKERSLAIKPAEKKKSVLVVGGGPGGMEAARVAALRGHKVSLWEKEDRLGGNLVPGSAIDFKGDYRILVNYLSAQVRKLGVAIELGREATAELIQKEKPDVVFIATGSKPIVPEIPGVENDNVITAIDFLLGKKEAGESLVVIGGGIVGCETALAMAQKGKRVTIVEALDNVARDMYPINRMHLLKLLSEAAIEILTKTTVLEITAEGIVVVDTHKKKRSLAADTVMLAVGLSPVDGLSHKLVDGGPEVFVIGDCASPRKVINAIWEGYRLARLI